MSRLFTVRAMMSVAALLASTGCRPTGTPANCTFTVQLAQHPGMFHGAGVPAAGGDYSVDVIANPSTCQVPTQTPDSWITITQEVPDRGLGFRITAAANTGAGRRTGTAFVGYQALTVDQAGTGGSGCTFQLIPPNSAFTATGGLGAFVVVPNEQRCGWSVDRTSTGEDWSTEASPIRGVGTAAIRFDVRSSTTAPQPPLPRQAEIRVTDSAGALVGAHAYAQQ
jgi:hypothetical protein